MSNPIYLFDGIDWVNVTPRDTGLFFAKIGDFSDSTTADERPANYSAPVFNTGGLVIQASSTFSSGEEIVIQKNGRYEIIYECSVGVSSDSVKAKLYINGNDDFISEAPVADSAAHFSVTAIVDLEDGDKIECSVLEFPSESFATVARNEGCRLIIKEL